MQLTFLCAFFDQHSKSLIKISQRPAIFSSPWLVHIFLTHLIFIPFHLQPDSIVFPAFLPIKIAY